MKERKLVKAKFLNLHCPSKLNVQWRNTYKEFVNRVELSGVFGWKFQIQMKVMILTQILFV